MHMSTLLSNTSNKPLDHAVSLFTCVLLGLALSACLQCSLFHHSSAYSSVFCFCGWDGVHNTQFWLLLGSDCMVSRLSFQPLGMAKRLGGYTASTSGDTGQGKSDIPIILCSAKKAEKKEVKMGLLVISLASLAHAHNVY